MEETNGRRAVQTVTNEMEDPPSANRAIVLLEDCGFRISDWISLSRRLGVPTDTRKEASRRSSSDTEALEECIEWFNKNNESASWSMFIDATGKVNVNAAKQLKKMLGQDQAPLLPVMPQMFATENISKESSFKLEPTIADEGNKSIFRFPVFVLLVAYVIYLTSTLLELLFVLNFTVFIMRLIEGGICTIIVVALLLKLDSKTANNSCFAQTAEATMTLKYKKDSASQAIVPLTSSGVSMSSVPVVKYEQYARIAERVRKLILHGSSDEEIRHLVVVRSSHLDDYRKAILYISLGFHYQMTNRYSPEICYENSKKELFNAIKILDTKTCINWEFLFARACTYLAQNFFYNGEFKLAKEYTDQSEMHFLNVGEVGHEKSGMLYQRAMLATANELKGDDTMISEEELLEASRCMDWAVDLASYSSRYEAQCLKDFMLVKKAMLYLGIFNFAHSMFSDRSTSIAKWHRQIAKICLTKVDPASIGITDTPTSYKGLYYLAKSEYNRHQGNFSLALDNLKIAENQFCLCKSQYPQRLIDKRRLFYQKELTDYTELAVE